MSEDVPVGTVPPSVHEISLRAPYVRLRHTASGARGTSSCFLKRMHGSMNGPGSIIDPELLDLVQRLFGSPNSKESKRVDADHKRAGGLGQIKDYMNVRGTMM